LKVRDDQPLTVNAGAMHKYAAPILRTEQFREAHSMGLELQVAAADLSKRHARDYRRSRRIRRMRRTAWMLVALAAVLLTIALAPLEAWWQEIEVLLEEQLGTSSSR
jgi:hypothetical protein